MENNKQGTPQIFQNVSDDDSDKGGTPPANQVEENPYLSLPKAAGHLTTPIPKTTPEVVIVPQNNTS